MNRRYRTEEDARVTLALGIAVWGIAVAAATFAGVFARLPQAVVVALGAFLTVFAVAGLLLDAGVRDFVATVRWKALVAAIALLAAAAAVSLPIALVFSLPLGAAAATALALRPRTPRLRLPASKSPAETPAAP